MKDSSIDGQISIFDILPPPEPAKSVKPGKWVDEDSLGEEITFDNIAKSVGNIIVLSKHTQNHKWYKAVLVEKIVERGGSKRLIYYDGAKQRGIVDERYFDKTINWPVYAWRLRQ